MNRSVLFYAKANTTPSKRNVCIQYNVVPDRELSSMAVIVVGMDNKVTELQNDCNACSSFKDCLIPLEK